MTARAVPYRRLPPEPEPLQTTSPTGPGQWLGGTGMAQLSDGSTFVFYSLPDIRSLKSLKPGKKVNGHSYIAGNTVTEADLLND